MSWWNRLQADCHSWSGPFYHLTGTDLFLGLVSLGWPTLPATGTLWGLPNNCPKAAGTQGKKERRRKRKKLALSSLDSLSILKMKRPREVHYVPKGTQQDVNQACLPGKPACVHDTTYCRLIKVVSPAGHLMVPPTPPPPETVPVAQSQTAVPASWAKLLLRARRSCLTTQLWGLEPAGAMGEG